VFAPEDGRNLSLGTQSHTAFKGCRPRKRLMARRGEQGALYPGNTRSGGVHPEGCSLDRHQGLLRRIEGGTKKCYNKPVLRVLQGDNLLV
jgi:hypothetical protein